MKKKQRKLEKAIFIQEWGTYTNQTLVAVGSSTDEMLRYLKKNKVNKASIDAFVADKQNLESQMQNSLGLFCRPKDGDAGSILWLKNWDKNNWRCYEILIHELFHAVYGILGKDKGMLDEEEALAYQQEYLFGEIRRKLNA